MYIGSHVSYSKDGILTSVKEAISYNANTFMFYLGAPHNTRRNNIDIDKLSIAKKLMIENNIDINKVIVHAPYIINLANNENIDKYNFSINFLKDEIDRCNIIGIKYIVIHPGNSLKQNKIESLNNLINSLNKVISYNNNITILIETMAGKGTEICSNIEDIKYVLDNVLYNNVGVCLDTCHIHDSGYDINDYLNEFDKVIGLNKVKCIHVNDSKNIVGSKKDRHENIGYGYIGFNNIIKFIYNDKLKDVPKILETPYYLDKPMYKKEIELIRNKEFIDYR